MALTEMVHAEIHSVTLRNRSRRMRVAVENVPCGRGTCRGDFVLHNLQCYKDLDLVYFFIDFVIFLNLPSVVLGNFYSSQNTVLEKVSL